MATRSAQGLARPTNISPTPSDSRSVVSLLSLVPQSQGRTGRVAPEQQVITISFDVHPDHAPALRSAIDDFTTIIGTRMESRYDYEVEDALVRASIAIGAMRAAVCAAVPKSEPKFPTRKGRS